MVVALLLASLGVFEVANGVLLRVFERTDDIYVKRAAVMVIIRYYG